MIRAGSSAPRRRRWLRVGALSLALAVPPAAGVVGVREGTSAPLFPAAAAPVGEGAPSGAGASPAEKAGAAASAEGTDAELLTLDDALRIAVENNRDIRQSVELRNRLEGRYVAERAAALPQLTVSGDLFRSRDVSQSAFGFPAGNETVEGQGSVTQPLYTGGQVQAAIRAARVGIATADDQLRISREAAMRDVSTAFHDVLLAKELLAIAVENGEQKRRLLDEARKKNLAGTATDYDVLVAEVGLQNARPAILQTENRIRTARERLRYLLGRGNREVDARGELATEVAPYPTYEDVLAEAWRNRPELSDLRHRIGIGEEVTVIARAGNRPHLDLRAGAGWRNVETGFGEAEGQNWTVGLLASWPLFDGLRTRGQVAQARSDVSSLRIEQERLLDAIAVEVREAVNALREAGEIVNALKGTVSQAQRLLALAEKGYEYGVKTKLEVDDAQLNLIQAKGNLARARRDYLVAGTALEFVKGTLYAAWAGPGAPGPPPWHPAESAAGIVREVLSGEPRLK